MLRHLSHVIRSRRASGHRVLLVETAKIVREKLQKLTVWLSRTGETLKTKKKLTVREANSPDGSVSHGYSSKECIECADGSERLDVIVESVRDGGENGGIQRGRSNANNIREYCQIVTLFEVGSDDVKVVDGKP